MILAKAIWMPIVVLATYSTCLVNDNNYGVLARPTNQQDYIIIDINNLQQHVPPPQPFPPINRQSIDPSTLKILAEKVCFCMKKTGNCVANLVKESTPLFAGVVTTYMVKQIMCDQLTQLYGDNLGTGLTVVLSAAIGAKTSNTVHNRLHREQTPAQHQKLG
jgi:hypothetical protein